MLQVILWTLISCVGTSTLITCPQVNLTVMHCRVVSFVTARSSYCGMKHSRIFGITFDMYFVRHLVHICYNQGERKVLMTSVKGKMRCTIKQGYSEPSGWAKNSSLYTLYKPNFNISNTVFVIFLSYGNRYRLIIPVSWISL